MTTWRHAGHVLSRDLPDGVVVLAAHEQAEPAVLVGTGYELWDVVAMPRSLDDIVTALAAAHPGDEGTIREDIERALADLAERGLVTDDDRTATEVSHGRHV